MEVVKEESELVQYYIGYREVNTILWKGLRILNNEKEVTSLKFCAFWYPHSVAQLKISQFNKEGDKPQHFYPISSISISLLSLLP